MMPHHDPSPSLAADGFGTLAYWLRLVFWCVITWMVLVLVFSLASSSDGARFEEVQVPFLRIINGWALGISCWIFLMPVVFAVGHRQGLKSTPLPRAIPQAAVLLILGFSFMFAYVLVVVPIARDRTPQQVLENMTAMSWFWDFFIFSVVLMAGRMTGERQVQRAQSDAANKLQQDLANARAARAEMEEKMLRQRFSSHFVQNALGNVMGLVRSGDNEKAEDALLILSRILRRGVEDGSEPLVPLRLELDLIKDYLAFQGIRYPALDISMEIDAKARDCLFPPQCLQPLVENAFKHGMTANGELRLTLTVSRESETLHVQVTNSVPPTRQATTTESGEGTRICLSRLELGFGARAHLARSFDNGTYTAEITAPVVRHEGEGS